MDVTNKSNEGITFTSALHTYFKVDDVDKIALRSLKVRKYTTTGIVPLSFIGSCTGSRNFFADQMSTKFLFEAQNHI